MKTIKFLIVAILYALISLSLPSSARSQEVRKIDETYPLTRDGEVSIETFKGSITVDTWDKTEVKIHAEIEPDGGGRDQAEKVRQTEIRITDSPDRIRIKSDYDRVDSHFSIFNFFNDNSGTLPFVHYAVTVPATAHLRIKDYKSETRISDLHSSIDLETYKGKVSVRNLDGSIDLETYKGDADLSFSKITDGCRIQTGKGKVTIGLPASSGFELDTDLGRRADFDSDFDAAYKSKHRNGDAFHGAVNGGGPLLRIISEKGDIRLRKTAD